MFLGLSALEVLIIVASFMFTVFEGDGSSTSFESEIHMSSTDVIGLSNSAKSML